MHTRRTLLVGVHFRTYLTVIPTPSAFNRSARNNCPVQNGHNRQLSITGVQPAQRPLCVRQFCLFCRSSVNPVRSVMFVPVPQIEVTRTTMSISGTRCRTVPCWTGNGAGPYPDCCPDPPTPVTRARTLKYALSHSNVVVRTCNHGVAGVRCWDVHLPGTDRRGTTRGGHIYHYFTG